MASQAGKLFRVIADMEITAPELELGRRYGRGQIVRLDLEEVVGTETIEINGKTKTRPVKLGELLRERALEPITDEELEAAPLPEAVLEAGPYNTEGDQE